MQMQLDTTLYTFQQCGRDSILRSFLKASLQVKLKRWNIRIDFNLQNPARSDRDQCFSVYGVPSMRQISDPRYREPAAAPNLKAQTVQQEKVDC